jgi:HEAT repeat protein
MIPDFQPYLESICAAYGQWWELYTLTDAQGREKIRAKQSVPFDFGLMVQTVKREERERRDEEKVECFPVLEGIRKYADHHVLLVGRPGSGKSTALARLMLEEATAPQARIPVLVELRYWQGSIEQLIRNSLTRHDLPDEQAEAVLQRFAQSATAKETLILFDGVNELPFEEARSQLSAFRRNHPNVPMIFTTRDLGLGGDLGIEKQLEMQPLTETQMQAFVRSYVPEQAEEMLRQLKDRLREFGQTPLLLWMLCEVFQQTPDNRLPSNLAEVFQAFTAMYENSSVRKHEVALLKGDVRPLSDRRLWKKALKGLALVMMQGETPVDFRVVIHRDEAERELSRLFSNEQFPVRDILDDLLKYHLLQNRSVDQIEFRHQLIQEYYAAEALLEQLLRLDDEVLKREYLNYLKWTEPVALMLALVDEAQGIRVVGLALDVDLMLGKRLVRKVQPNFQAKMIEWVDKKVPSWLEPVTPADRTSSGFTFFPPGYELPLIETSPQAVLDLVVDPHSSYDAVWSEANGLNAIGSNDIILSLLKLLESSDSNIRWRTAVVLGQIGSAIAIPNLIKLLKDPDSNVRRFTIGALGEIRSDAAILELCKLIVIHESSVRQEIAVALGKIHSEAAIAALLKLITDSEISVREQAAYSLGNIGSATAISDLLQLLKDSDSDSDVSWMTAHSIRRIANKSEDKITISQHLPHLLTLIPTDSGEAAHYVIRAIQENCKYYNYEIYQAYLEAQKNDRQKSQTNDRSSPIYNIGSVGILNTGTVTIEGNQIGVESSTPDLD